jgi:hypothetical protein
MVLASNRRIGHEVKHCPVGDGLARGDQRGIHRRDEIGAAEDDQSRTVLGAVAGEQPTSDEPRLEVLDRRAVGQGATGLGFDVEHLRPKRRNEHLAIAAANRPGDDLLPRFRNPARWDMVFRDGRHSRAQRAATRLRILEG